MEIPTAWKTYLAAGAIIVHQMFKLAGVDVPSETFSDLIDGALGVVAVITRIIGYVKAKKAIEVALYTPVPTTPPGGGH